MANCRFYTPLPLALKASVVLSESATAHATRALRLNVGDAITLFNGDGLDYCGILSEVKKNQVVAYINSVIENHTESPLNITLLQGISSGERMDFTIQKTVELGVSAIQPILTERSVVKLSVDRAQKRVEHWQHIVHAACEQSGRAFVPPVTHPCTLTQWVANTANRHTSSTRILLNPMGAKRLPEMAKPSKNIVLLIGAEGGLSPKEIEFAIAHDFQSTLLGKRILRTETAALTAIAAMQTLWGDF